MTAKKPKVTRAQIYACKTFEQLLTLCATAGINPTFAAFVYNARQIKQLKKRT